MTESEEAELAHLMETGIKRCVAWYRAQDFSQMNELRHVWVSSR